MKREYKLAASATLDSHRLTPAKREIIEIADGDRHVILAVASDDAMDVRDALARAYENGRSDA